MIKAIASSSSNISSMTVNEYRWLGLILFAVFVFIAVPKVVNLITYILDDHDEYEKEENDEKEKDS